jgi:hypothetical protein
MIQTLNSATSTTDRCTAAGGTPTLASRTKRSMWTTLAASLVRRRGETPVRVLFGKLQLCEVGGDFDPTRVAGTGQNLFAGIVQLSDSPQAGEGDLI